IASLKERLAAEPAVLRTEQPVPNPLRDRLRTELEDLRRNLHGLQAQRLQLAAQYDAQKGRVNQLAPMEVQLAQLTSARDSAMKSLETIGERLEDLTIRENARDSTSRIMEHADVPPAPIRPNKPANILLSALLGMIMGVALAFLLESLDDRITTP